MTSCPVTPPSGTAASCFPVAGSTMPSVCSALLATTRSPEDAAEPLEGKKTASERPINSCTCARNITISSIPDLDLRGPNVRSAGTHADYHAWRETIAEKGPNPHGFPHCGRLVRGDPSLVWK